MNTIPIPPKEKGQRVKIPAFKPSQVLRKKRVILAFDGEFAESFGQPERHAKWFITGPPYSGKSSFVFQVCKYLCRFGKVDYNNYEEGDALTVAQKLEKHGLLDQDAQFKLLPRVPIEHFKERLMGKRSAMFAIVDSLQHGQINKKLYDDFSMSLSNPRRGKSLVFISHWVKNDFTKHVKHDCDIKIEVLGFVAHIESRYGGNRPFVIWEEGAKRYWGKKYKQVAEGRYWPGQKM